MKQNTHNKTGKTRINDKIYEENHVRTRINMFECEQIETQEYTGGTPKYITQ